MSELPWLVRFHLAAWTALSIPTLLAGVVFLLPEPHLIAPLLLGIAGLLLASVWLQAGRDRRGWQAGIGGHMVLLVLSPILLSWAPPLALGLAALNALSVAILLGYRSLWQEGPTSA